MAEACLYRLRVFSLVDEESDADDASGAHSIHETLRQKEDGLGELLYYDAGRRLLGVEHLLLPGEDLESLWHARARQIADLSAVGYVPTLHRESDRVRLELRGVASLEGGGEIVLDKTWTLWRDGSGLELRLGLELSGTETVLEARLCSEWNLALLAGRAHDRYYRLPGVAGEECQLASAGVVLGVDHVGLTDAWRGLDVDLALSREATLWRFPIETVSLSEAGAERLYQCSAVVPVWDLTLRPAERQELTVRLELAPVRAPSATT